MLKETRLRAEMETRAPPSESASPNLLKGQPPAPAPVARPQMRQTLAKHPVMPSPEVGPREVIPTSGGNLLWRAFLIVALLPTIAMGIYLFFIASPEYVSEARVVVRTAQEDKSNDMQDALSVITKVAGGPSSKTSISDSYIVQEYVGSRSIIYKLGGISTIERYFSGSTVDFFSRMSTSQPIEMAWYYWRTMVGSSIDTQSGIISISARAFTQDDAYKLMKSIIAACEAQLNDISQRARNDAINRAVVERDAAAQRLNAARAALLDFRSHSQSLDPTADATQYGGLLAKLTMERIETENEMAISAGSLAANSPTRRLLDIRLQAIDTQIASIQQKLTGSNLPSSISQLLSKYEELQLEAQFAERLYATSEAAIETARRQADRQQLYLAEVVSPTLPQYALYPRATLMTFFTFLAGVAIWMLGVLVVAGIRDHMV